MQTPIRFSKLLLAVVLATLVAVSVSTMGLGASDENDRGLLPLRVAAGEKAPDFALPSAHGKTVKLADFAGHNVLIDFYRGYW